MTRKLLAPRDSDDVVDSMRENATLNRRLTETLTANIAYLQNTLAGIPGRVRTVCKGRHPDIPKGDGWLALLFDRVGRKWRIDYATIYAPNEDGEQDEPVDWKALTEAPIKIKIAAVEIFPDLLDTMLAEQESFGTTISDSIAAVERLTERLIAKGIKPKTEDK